MRVFKARDIGIVAVSSSQAKQKRPKPYKLLNCSDSFLHPLPSQTSQHFFSFDCGPLFSPLALEVAFPASLMWRLQNLRSASNRRLVYGTSSGTPFFRWDVTYGFVAFDVGERFLFLPFFFEVSRVVFVFDAIWFQGFDWLTGWRFGGHNDLRDLVMRHACFIWVVDRNVPRPIVDSAFSQFDWHQL